MRLHASAKAGLIATIKANARNTFTDAQLAVFDYATLESLAALAKPAPDYSGLAQAGIAANAGQLAQNAQQEANSGFAAPPPRLGLVTNADGGRGLVKDPVTGAIRSV